MALKQVIGRGVAVWEGPRAARWLGGSGGGARAGGCARGGAGKGGGAVQWKCGRPGQGGAGEEEAVSVEELRAMKGDMPGRRTKWELLVDGGGAGRGRELPTEGAEGAEGKKRRVVQGFHRK